jgi:transposase
MMEAMIGIDPDKATHTAVAIGPDERVLAELKVRVCAAQVERLWDWAGRFEQRAWAVESAGGLGYLLSQQLVAAGETVFDVSPMLAARVQLLGSGSSQKNDPSVGEGSVPAMERVIRLLNPPE